MCLNFQVSPSPPILFFFLVLSPCGVFLSCCKSAMALASVAWALSNCLSFLFYRGVMWELNTGLEYTITHLSKRKKPKNLWSNNRRSWTGRLSQRFFLPRSSTGQKNTINSTLRKGVDLVPSNLLLRDAMIQFDAMVKFIWESQPRIENFLLIYQ